jgi:predicted flap endonuclease-1-like 5' DNA nuclease
MLHRTICFCERENMTWLSDFQTPQALRERAEKTLSLPIGLANPLWLAFGAAATTGAAWWMLTRLAKPANLEAIVAKPVQLAAAGPAAAEAAVKEPELELQPAVEATVEPVIEAATRQLDDLTRLAGVGPRIAAALAERGVTSFVDLAAWTPEQLATFDAERKLMGRSLREDWLAQAKALAAEA